MQWGKLKLTGPLRNFGGDACREQNNFKVFFLIKNYFFSKYIQGLAQPPLLLIKVILFLSFHLEVISPHLYVKKKDLKKNERDVAQNQVLSAGGDFVPKNF